jgi:hypothetical protein
MNSTNDDVMLKFFTLSVLFFVCLNSWSSEYKRMINWSDEVSSNGKISLSFRGSIVLDRSELPYFLESFEVKTSNPQVVLHDVAFEPVPDSLLALFDNIGSEIKFRTEMGFSGGRSIMRLVVFPFVKKDNRVERITEFSFSITENLTQLKSATAGYSWKTSSVLSSGKWVKIKTTDKGIYKITYDQLKAWGFTNPDQVVLYGNGGYMLPVMNSDTPVDDLSIYPVLKAKDSTGKDCIFFYSTGNLRLSVDSGTGIVSHQQNYYSTETYFYLSDKGTVKTIDKSAEISGSVGRQVSSFNNYAYYEKETLNLLSSGSRWFGEKFNPGQSQTLTLTLDNPDLTKSVQFSVAAVGRSSSSSYLNINVNGTSKNGIEFYSVQVTKQDSNYADDKIVTFTDQLSSKTVPVKLTYTASTSTSNAWLDYISINYQSLLNMSSDVYLFRGKGAEGTATISEFTLSGATSATRVIDVTDINNATEVPVAFSSSQLTFKSNASDYREYVAFNPTGSIPIPERVGDVSNQNLHGNTTPEMIIVTYSDLESAANSIAAFHQTNDNMTVEVITPDKIYNEFSGGLPDPSGLRNYFRMYYDRDNDSGKHTLKYILLMGDGSYDNRNILGLKHNLLPTYQSENSISPTESFVSDDFFVFLDKGEGGSKGIVDLGIGRIPASTLTQAKAVVGKIQNYVKSASIGNWRNVVTFIADDEDDNTHMIQAERLANFVNSSYPAFYTDKIYLDAYMQVSSSGGDTYPEVNAAITNRVKQGTLVMNYTGHANEKALAGEKILEIGTIQSWSNFNKLPVFVTATCEFSKFDADETSAGEEILFNPQGGGIGLFSTTRLVYSESNFELNSKFFDYIFEADNEGNNLRLGDVMQKAKAAANTGINQLNFTLLADPALRLANPALQVKTSSINGESIDTKLDTIRPLSTVTIKGYIADYKGSKVTTFNGEIIPSVYDKAQTVETLGNGGEPPMSYKVQSNLIYKGLATVTNGEFEFSFIVPKDVAFKFDKGKILYYAYNNEANAKGYFDEFYVGGTSTKTVTDTNGPNVKLYMNSESFKDGSEVGASAVLIANISDETGINTSGIGIGHDITAILDGDNSNIMILNDYFQSAKDVYTSGKVVFPLTGLSEGEHTITFKVWDVLNNSSEAKIHFVVTDVLRIESVSCYPNPMQTQTNFIFTHNYPDESFSVTLDVYQINGSLVDSYTTTVGSLGAESLPIVWTPSDRQIRMRAGIYVYRITATSASGNIAKGSGRLVFIYP